MALIGIDGSGKSTQARWLAEWLTASGTPARYHRNAAGRVFLGRLARRLGRRDAEHLLGVRLFLVVETVLRGLVIARALLISRLTGTVAVMDRHVPCQYVSITVRGGRTRWARRLFAALPTPDLVCRLALPPSVAQERVERRGKDHEALWYLEACDAAYRALPEAPSFTVIDAEAGPVAVQADLRAVLAGRSAPPGAASPRPELPHELRRPRRAGRPPIHPEASAVPGAPTSPTRRSMGASRSRQGLSALDLRGRRCELTSWPVTPIAPR